ncbi:ferritin-like domain-containing protein [Kitasatospora cineracea]|uniref:Uncharacterized protein DUF4439 n=1 Tax=Kitasatospora cineracea TaxID=88074 RepID=A0A3N4S7J9_9ACTN|nr:ferritin-like domain-containing protein [Kitasatospora cineracea]RPE32384.1 uncharacterized protein DUF4439 [Kitasatospora cineracea]
MPAPTRRTLLALGALTGLQLLCGCTDDHPAEPKPTAADPDRPLRLRQLAATDALLADYDVVLTAAPADADRLGNLREDVARHREALAGPLPSPSAAGSAASGSASASVSASGSASPAAGPAARTVAELGAAEQRTAALRLADLAAASPELARTLASIAASDAAHAAALGDTTAPAPAPSPSASASAGVLPAADTAALQAALAAEHAAVYGYGVVGAFLPTGPQREDARSGYSAHQARRDAWQRLLAAGGASPTAAAPGYRLPFAVKDPATAAQLAAHLETQLTAAYADLAATTALREQAAAALREAALRAAHWGADLPALPGLAAAS